MAADDLKVFLQQTDDGLKPPDFNSKAADILGKADIYSATDLVGTSVDQLVRSLENCTPSVLVSGGMFGLFNRANSSVELVVRCGNICIRMGIGGFRVTRVGRMRRCVVGLWVCVYVCDSSSNSSDSSNNKSESV